MPSKTQIIAAIFLIISFFCRFLSGKFSKTSEIPGELFINLGETGEIFIPCFRLKSVLIDKILQKRLVLDAVDDAEYSGSIISLLQEAIAFVARNSKKAWMKLPDDRQEMPEYPERAVLESVVNALIHRDYLEYGSEVHIDMFDDRLEIYSPGGMMDGTMVQNLDVLSVPSRRRNPVIADIFNRLHYMDRRGSGFKKIVEDYQMYANVSNGAKPVFKSELSSFFITLPNLQYVVKGQDGTKDVTKDVIKDVTKEQADILDVMRDNPNVKTAEMSQRIGLTQRHILRLIKELTDKEVIRRDGGRRYGKWMILKEYRGKDSE